MNPPTPEERQRIYEEEKARATGRSHAEAAIKREKRMKVAILVFLILVLFSLVSSEESRRNEGSANSEAPSRAFTGEEGRLIADAYLAVDDAAWDALSKVAAAKDALAFLEWVASGRVFLLTEGTRILVVESGFLSIRVRALEGPNAGRAGWVESEFVVRP